MDRSEIFDKIAEVAADVLGVDVAEISDETTFDDLDANSLERLQLVTAIEDEFNLEIDDETLLAQLCRRRRRRYRSCQGGLSLGFIRTTYARPGDSGPRVQ